VWLPAHLRTLARVGGEVEVEVAGPVTQRSVLDALETCYPMLRGTLRDHVTEQRRRGGIGGGALFDCGGHCRGMIHSA
jgi:sulfur-carrier protein